VANHAGTTPMNRRHDALAAAARDVLAVRDVVRAESGTQVGNVGFVRAEPGAINVVTGRAEFPVELRDLDEAKVDRMWEAIQGRLKEVDGIEGVQTACTPLDDVKPAKADPRLQNAIREAARGLGLATLDLPSFAGQDSQQIARIAPMAMIFVPSKDGISHSPKEFTSWEDIANGAAVLYRTLLILDGRAAGNEAAAMADAPSTSTAAAVASGSTAATPKSCDRTRATRPMDSGTPRANPPASNRPACPRIRRTMSPGRAPIATRTPISRNRCATPWLRTP
jgi:metal-dependent amidase/aminoacylase/carboxypeptidase family protein